MEVNVRGEVNVEQVRRESKCRGEDGQLYVYEGTDNSLVWGIVSGLDGT